MPLADGRHDRIEIQHRIGSTLERLRRGNAYTRELVERSKEQIGLSLKLLKRSERQLRPYPSSEPFV